MDLGGGGALHSPFIAPPLTPTSLRFSLFFSPQLEDDADREIDELKEVYEKKLAQEREAGLRLKVRNVPPLSTGLWWTAVALASSSI